MKIGDSLYDKDGRVIRSVQSDQSMRSNVAGSVADEDNIFPLVLETILNNHGVLIFCATKKHCETICESIAKKIWQINSGQTPLRLDAHGGGATSGFVSAAALPRFVPLDSAGLIDVQEQLRRTPAGLDKRLAPCVRWGVCFHHAGLTFDERDILEAAFKRGLVKVVVATSTLSSGVNLPARRVIVRTPTFHAGQPLDIGVYKQMVGRAGRKGVDVAGESILMAKANERARAFSLLNGDLKPVVSSLETRKKTPAVAAKTAKGGAAAKGENKMELSGSLKRAVLEVTVNGLAKTAKDVEDYMNCTLLAAAAKLEQEQQHDKPAEKSPIKSRSDDPLTAAIQFLEKEEFLEIRKSQEASAAPPPLSLSPAPSASTTTSSSAAVSAPTLASSSSSATVDAHFVPSQLGSAVLASALSPDEGIAVFRELSKARKKFVLENELHLVYHITPIYQRELWAYIDWQRYYNLYEALSADMRHVADVIGVKESFIVKCATRGVDAAAAAKGGAALLATHRRFYGALMLHDLINETPLEEVAAKYTVARGALQSAQTNASTFAGMVHTFCNRLGEFVFYYVCLFHFFFLLFIVLSFSLVFFLCFLSFLVFCQRRN